MTLSRSRTRIDVSLEYCDGGRIQRQRLGRGFRGILPAQPIEAVDPRRDDLERLRVDVCGRMGFTESSW